MKKKSPSVSFPGMLDDAPPIVIRPPAGWVDLDLSELWAYRELLFFLVWRDVKVRYRQTALGVAWAVLQPVLTMIVFTVFFGHLGKIPSDGMPYPLFAFCALLPWQLFARTLTESSTSLVVSQNLITKVYFPRLVVPAAVVFGGLIDFAIAFGVLLLLMPIFATIPSRAVWTLPLFVVLVVALSLGVGLWLSMLNVRYRDVRYAVPFLTQLWLFITPVAYPSTLLSEPWRTLYGLNPMAGVVEGFRWALLGAGQAPGGLVLVAVVVTTAILISGLYYFRSVERTIADTI